MDVERVHEALSAALTDRDAARQMCQEVRAMLAQSEALRKADPDRKVGFTKHALRSTCAVSTNPALPASLRAMCICLMLGWRAHAGAAAADRDHPFAHGSDQDAR